MSEPTILAETIAGIERILGDESTGSGSSVPPDGYILQGIAYRMAIGCRPMGSRPACRPVDHPSAGHKGQPVIWALALR
jgi:hypothetical protein